MFTKLLKHDFKATWGVLGLLSLIILGAGLLGGTALRYLIYMSMEESEFSILILMCVLALIGAVISIAICGAGSMFVLIGRFYKSRFTDEGYLTFTLPVTSHQILLSSLANSAIGMLITGAAAVIAVAIIVGMGITAPGLEIQLGDVVTEFSRIFQDMADAMGIGKGGYIALTTLGGIVSFFYELIILMLAVTIGAQIAKKHKILAAFGVYYGIQMGMSFISAIFGAVLMIAMMRTADSVMIWSMVFPSVLGLLIGIFAYFLMHYLVTKKLNLT